MLVHQGAEAFRLWTGVEPPLAVMFQAARAALRETGQSDTATGDDRQGAAAPGEGR